MIAATTGQQLLSKQPEACYHGRNQQNRVSGREQAEYANDNKFRTQLHPISKQHRNKHLSKLTPIKNYCYSSISSAKQSWSIIYSQIFVPSNAFGKIIKFSEYWTASVGSEERSHKQKRRRKMLQFHQQSNRRKQTKGLNPLKIDMAPSTLRQKEGNFIT